MVPSGEASLVPSEIETPSARHRRGFPVAWTVVACLLLGVAGAVRAVQDRRHKDELSYKEPCPIALDRLPKNLGGWQMIDKSETKLDDQTMRITGGSDHLIRTYADNLTGVSVVVLILYGPAVPVLPHTPEVCYPASGYSRADAPTNQVVAYATGRESAGQGPDGKALFRSAGYQRGGGRITLREVVYHSFRLDGEWSPDIGVGRKFPRRNPGIFKIQVQRQVAEGEILAKGDPIEQFLGSLISELEVEIKASGSKPVVAR